MTLGQFLNDNPGWVTLWIVLLVATVETVVTIRRRR